MPQGAPRERLRSARGVPARFAPAEIIVVDLVEQLPTIASEGADSVLLVVTLAGDPVGMTLAPAVAVANPDDLVTVLRRDLATLIDEAAQRHGIVAPLLPGPVDHVCAWCERRRRIAADGAPVSVILCTRNRPESLGSCVASILASHHRRFELIVVDNDPSTDVTRRFVAEFNDSRTDADSPVRYVAEPRPGLSRARNAGIAHSTFELLAFVDDDERVDPWWLTEVVAEFESPDVGCVSGLVLPAELRNVAQAQFEQFGGHSKGRGFDRVRFDAKYLEDVQPAVYPLPPFGVGANMAFRKSAIERVGGFDVALGAGTPTFAAEDTLAFTQVLLDGWEMVYAPAAVTWHHHRVDGSELDRQMFGYGVGLGAFYAAVIAHDKRRVTGVLRVLGRGVRDIVDPSSPRNASSAGGDDGPAGVSLRGLVIGPWRYWRERRRARRA